MAEKFPDRYPATGMRNSRGGISRGVAILAAIGLVVLATVLCEQARPYLSPINMVMAYLLAVVLAAVFLGRMPAMVSAFLGVLAFDFFFVPPRFSFQIADKEYLITFVALFTVGMVISTLVATARERLEALRLRELQNATLYHLSRSLTAAADREAIVAAVIKNVEETLGAQVALFLPAGDGNTVSVAGASGAMDHDQRELEVANWCFTSRRIAGNGTDSYSDAPLTYLPMKLLTDSVGVLGIRLVSEDPQSPQNRRLLDSIATQTAMALERARLMQEAQEAQILKARDSLERALLNSISHDLRTPLAAITGALTAVLDEGEKLKEISRTELLVTAREEAERLNHFVGNLLDMTRLEAGALRPRLELCDVQDLIGCALGAIEKRIGRTEVRVEIPPDLPLVPMDLALMVQVLVNLLDNALKYAPEGRVEIASYARGADLFIEVADHGPGIAAGELARIFDKFYRTPVPEGVGGTGLGLSICKGIVEAHGGSIRAENNEGSGLRVIIKLPVTASEQPAEVAHGN